MKNRLHGECECLRPEGIRKLLEAGEDVNEFAEGLGTPLELALCTYMKWCGRQRECINLLIEGGAKYEDGPLIDIHRGYLRQLERRLRRDADLVHVPIVLWSPHLSRYYGGQGTGAPLNGATLLHICAEFNEVAAAELLLAYGANVNARSQPDQNGVGNQTPIYHAVATYKGFTYPMVKFLVEQGADLSLRSSLLLNDHDEVLEQATPLDYANKFRARWDYQPDPRIVELLVEHGAC